jgi:hypothetical protein
MYIGMIRYRLLTKSTENQIAKHVQETGVEQKKKKNSRLSPVT